MNSENVETWHGIIISEYRSREGHKKLLINKQKKINKAENKKLYKKLLKNKQKKINNAEKKKLYKKLLYSQRN